MTPEELLQPQISAEEAMAAMQLLYPQLFENVMRVIANAKRMALIPKDEEDADAAS